MHATPPPSEYNKGLAFSDGERDRLYLRGLLPPVTLSQEVQLERTVLNLRNKASDLDKFTYMQSLQVRTALHPIHIMSTQENHKQLFYWVMVEHFEEFPFLCIIPSLPMQERDERLYNRVMVDDFESPHSPFLHLCTPPIHKRTMQERAQ